MCSIIWRFLRAQKIDLAGRKSWCKSNDPEFAAKAADVVGLYMEPPENAIVICVAEKPSIQALARAQGYLKLPNGRALTGHSHDYKRNGTSTLFAAFEVAAARWRRRWTKAKSARSLTYHLPGPRFPSRDRPWAPAEQIIRDRRKNSGPDCCPLPHGIRLLARPPRRSPRESRS
jgi:hypothetical protein